MTTTDDKTPPTVPAYDIHHSRLRMSPEEVIKQMDRALLLKRLWQRGQGGDNAAFTEYYQKVVSWQIRGSYATTLRSIMLLLASETFLAAFTSVPEFNEAVFGTRTVDYGTTPAEHEIFVRLLIKKLTARGDVPFNSYRIFRDTVGRRFTNRQEMIAAKARWLRLILLGLMSAKVENLRRYMLLEYRNGKPFIDRTAAIEEAWLRHYRGENGPVITEEPLALDESAEPDEEEEEQLVAVAPAPSTMEEPAEADIVEEASPFDFLAGLNGNAPQETVPETAEQAETTKIVNAFVGTEFFDELIERVASYERNHAVTLLTIQNQHEHEIELLKGSFLAREMLLQETISNQQKQIDEQEALLSSYSYVKDLLETIESDTLEVLSSSIREGIRFLTPETTPHAAEGDTPTEE